jgi:hypothetical protein
MRKTDDTLATPTIAPARRGATRAEIVRVGTEMIGRGG